MTRQAQLAQYPRLIDLHDGRATFEDGQQITIQMTTTAWEAIGRPVDLQVILTPKAQGGFADVFQPPAEAMGEYLAQDREAREGLEAGL